jgi:4-aminobutyrate aminotransferase/(S)-3-amino-2-methylpropionate transaminase
MTMTKTDSYASIAARERYVPRGLANTHGIFVDRAEGTRIWDVDGKEYLDFTSGIGVLNTGHRATRASSAPSTNSSTA